MTQHSARNRLTGRPGIVAAGALLTGGCEGRTSMLAGAGEEAAAVEALFWAMLIGAAVIWVLVMALALYAARAQPAPERESVARVFVLWGGMIVPVTVLVALLITGLLLLRDLDRRQPDLQVAVEGEQWWWRVDYTTPEGLVSTANEFRIPLGRTVALALRSDDVIHSLWAPALGGKMDMVPGRTNLLKLTPRRTGRWGGACAEFCGTAHAQMRLQIVVVPPDEFDAWLAAEAQPARTASEEGREVFLAAGCGACHTVRGTGARGVAGPDLTHLAARAMFAAGVLPLSRGNLRDWIRDPEALKPGALMPAFPDIAPERMEPLLDYLTGLT